MAFEYNHFVEQPLKEWLKVILDSSKFLNIDPEESHSFQLFSIIAMDSVWFLRNQVIHHAQSQHPLTFSKSILKIYQEHNLMWHTKRQQKVIPPEWIPPPTYHFSISYDIAVRNFSSTATALCRSSSRKLIFAATRKIDSINPVFGEPMATKLAIEEALHRQFQNIVIEGDCQVVAKSLNNPSSSTEWSIFNIILDYSFLLKSFQK